MDMKLNATLLKKLREERAWSQEHLASVAGLSPRTIQRVESDGGASAETRMALASALNVDVAELNAPENTPPATVVENANVQTPMRSRRKPILWHLVVYLLVGSFLVFLDIRHDGILNWAYWPLLGWGLGLLLHWLKRTFPAAPDGKTT